MLAGCIVERPPGIAISNDLVEPVEITYPGDPAIPAVRLDPAETKTFTFGLGGPGIASDGACTSADIVATSLDGRVLARIPPPICHDRSRSLSTERGLINDTTEPVHVFQPVKGREEALTTLEIGDASGWVFHNVPERGLFTCTDSDIVLRNDDGTEFARIRPPLCAWEPVFLSMVPAGVSTGRP